MLIRHELSGEQEEDILTPINYAGAGEMGRLEQVAYYENPGILMIVQSVEDQDTSRFHRGKKNYQSVQMLKEGTTYVSQI